jgi:hypothetical protein
MIHLRLIDKVVTKFKKDFLNISSKYDTNYSFTSYVKVF